MAGTIFNLFTPGALSGEVTVDIYTPVVDVSEFRSGSAQLEVFGMQGVAGTNLNVDIQFSDDGINWITPAVPGNFTPVPYAGPGPTTASQLLWLDALPAYVRLHIFMNGLPGVNLGATFRVTANLKTE
jgi:hypothetical protein